MKSTHWLFTHLRVLSYALQTVSPESSGTCWLDSCTRSFTLAAGRQVTPRRLTVLTSFSRSKRIIELQDLLTHQGDLSQVFLFQERRYVEARQRHE